MTKNDDISDFRERAVSSLYDDIKKFREQLPVRIEILVKNELIKLQLENRVPDSEGLATRLTDELDDLYKKIDKSFDWEEQYKIILKKIQDEVKKQMKIKDETDLEQQIIESMKIERLRASDENRKTNYTDILNKYTEKLHHLSKNNVSFAACHTRIAGLITAYISKHPVLDPTKTLVNGFSLSNGKLSLHTIPYDGTNTTRPETQPAVTATATATIDKIDFNNNSPGDWKFNENVAKNFDDHVKKSVPFYEECQRMILEMSDYYVTDNSCVYDLGVSTGSMLKKIMQKHMNGNIRFFGYDYSQPMINYASKDIGSFSNLILERIDLNKQFALTNASLVLLNYTLQFVEPKNRQEVILTIYDGLNANGALIFIEKVIGNETRFNEMFMQLYYDLKIRNGLSLEHIKKKEDSLRGILKTYTLEQNHKLLTNAGFSNIDIFFKWYNFVGIIAVK